MLQIRNANNDTGADVTQTVYVTANQVQVLSQSVVYYLVELTSQTSLNSVYFVPQTTETRFLPRCIGLTFTVVDKNTTTLQPGEVRFSSTVAGPDAYPMGFYHYTIYEQKSSTNLDPTGLTALEHGIAYVL